MVLLQVKIEDKLSKAIKKKSAAYGVPASSLIKIVLTKSFMEGGFAPGNIFNANRDNAGKGLGIDDLTNLL